MTVIRVKHTEQYVVIKKTALEDPNLSFKAKGLWAYCMSRPNDWEFNITHLATVSKEKEVAVYSAIKELIKAGYAMRNQENKGKGEGNGRGSFGKTDYIVYEDCQIKNSFTLRGFADAGHADACNQGQLSIDTKLSNEKKKTPVGADALRLSSLLYESIKKIFPDSPIPNLKGWAKDIDLMIRVDRRSPEAIERIIAYLPTDSFWCKNVLSGHKLRKQFDRLQVEAQPKKGEYKGGKEATKRFLKPEEQSPYTWQFIYECENKNNGTFQAQLDLLGAGAAEFYKKWKEKHAKQHPME